MIETAPRRPARTGLPVAGQVALAAGFCLLLGLPAVVPADRDSSEKRAVAQRPAFSWRGVQAFPKNYERYFNDRFGLRRLFVRTHSALKVRILRVSPLAKVVVGRDGWLYYDGTAARDGFSFSAAAGGTGYSPQALAGVAAKVKAQSDWLGKRGSRYVVIVAPDKESIYPEHLPAARRRRRGRSRLDQVAEILLSRRLPLVDPRAALLRAKARGPLYYRADTHWNSLGGFVAYRELSERLRESVPALTPVRWEDFTVHVAPVAVRDGDLAVMLSLEGLFDDQEVAIALRNPHEPRERLGKALFFHDSFGAGFSDLLELHFAEVIRREGAIDFRAIEEQRPDVVIFEVAERYLDRLVKSEMPPRPEGSLPPSPGSHHSGSTSTYTLAAGTGSMPARRAISCRHAASGHAAGVALFLVDRPAALPKDAGNGILSGRGELKSWHRQRQIGTRNTLTPTTSGGRTTNAGS